ncbi:MAG: S1 family peptidase [Kofleriaceae bacterium]
MSLAARRVHVLVAILLGTAGCGEPPPLGQAPAPIVNGVTDLNHRYVVGVGGTTQAFCTGTVVSRRTVVTAGHCIGGVRNIFVGPSVTGGAATRVPVIEEVRHPRYRALPNDNATYDLGLLHLGADAPVQAAPLFRDTLTNTPRFLGPALVFVGYGATSGGGAGFGIKRATTFPIKIVGPAVVGGSYPAPDDLTAELFYYLGTDTMGRNTCNGDSGGPAFFVEHGVEHLIGVTSSGDAACTLDGADQRTDLPFVTDFIQPYLDAWEGADRCRADGACADGCDQGGQLGDPDCAAARCGADGVCAEACTAPRDPDCAATSADACGDDGVCDPACAADPDCARQCGAEGNCLAGCATPDPDCAAQPDAGSGPDAGPDGGAALDDEDAAGCGCSSAPDPRGAGLVLGVLGMALARRRRRA